MMHSCTTPLIKRSTTALSVRGALQTAVLAAEQWALQWHGRFGHAKTKQLNIGQRQNLPLATVIEDHQIEEVVRHKHLGITFTSDLKWNVHTQEVIGNAAKRAGLLRWMSHHLRGPLIAHLYLAYVRPTMEYASPPLAWFHSWRRCATTRENPSSSRSPNPACPMGHSEKTTSWRTQLAFSSMASRNSQPLPPPSIAARTTGPSQRHTSTVRINLQHPLTKKTKRTDSRQCTHHTIQQVILFQNIRSMEHSSRTPSATHQPTPI